MKNGSSSCCWKSAGMNHEHWKLPSFLRVSPHHMHFAKEVLAVTQHTKLCSYICKVRKIHHHIVVPEVSPKQILAVRWERSAGAKTPEGY